MSSEIAIRLAERERAVQVLQHQRMLDLCGLTQQPEQLEIGIGEIANDRALGVTARRMGRRQAHCALAPFGRRRRPRLTDLFSARFAIQGRKRHRRRHTLGDCQSQKGAAVKITDRVGQPRLVTGVSFVI
ncbi:MAG: hypothetical protein ACR2PO_00075 [Methyloligellaceae bacterium]